METGIEVDNPNSSQDKGINPKLEQTESHPPPPATESSRPIPEIPFSDSGFPMYPSMVGMPMPMPMPMPMMFYQHPMFPLAAYNQDQEQRQQQQSGIYAVAGVSYPWAPAFHPGSLVPLTYNIPSSFSTGADNASSDGSLTQSDVGRGSPAEAREAPAPEGLHQRHGGPARDVQGPRNDNQRQVVRRFQVGFQVDLLLMLKLAVVVFVFNQDGSKERLLLLLSVATLVYLYQTGALAPLLRWLSQGVQWGRLPPQPPARVVQPQHAARPEGPEEVGNGPNVQNVARQGPQGAAAQEVPNDIDGPGGRIDQEAGPPQGFNWWGFVKEIQMFVVGFVTSLLPGFHHVD